ncbi:Major facilitator superfamily domain, general substrate transporter [Pleurostoma richardsiae]|uniref:Major facilitator superfamily domain, general substrate transporter n=1 Tax=Pleurostoma richardsiae TaxID=41990 RepID=A0AA38R435_9PEZI|nr:Major facilitator superfamily domain, general substrate transporter [Pleurostoma richardsiae]
MAAAEAPLDTPKEEDNVPALKHVDITTMPVGSAKQPLLYSANPLLIFSMVVFGCSTLLFGYDNNIIGTLAALERFVARYQGPQPNGELVFTARNQDILYSLPLVGTILGAVISTPQQNYFGRKWSLIQDYTFSIGGVFLQLFAPNFGAFVAGRFWNGLGYGSALAIAPLYLADIVPASYRGISVASSNIFTIFSGTIATCVMKGTSTIDSDLSYKIPLAIQCALPVILIPLTAILPESPVWLLRKDRLEEARRTLRKLRRFSDEEVDGELAVMQRDQEGEMALTAGVRLWDIFARKQLRRTITAGSLFSMNQISGIILSTTYATVFLVQLGAGNAFTLTVVANICQLAGAIAGTLWVDRFRRRTVALTGMTILAVIDFTAGGLAFNSSDPSFAKGVAALSFIFNFVWTSTFYTLSLLMPSEIPTPRLRNMTMSYAIAWGQTTAVITTFASPQLVNTDAANLGAKAYLVWGGCMVGVITFMYFMLPDTNGRTVGEVDEMYGKKIPMRHWGGYVCSSAAPLDLRKVADER